MSFELSPSCCALEVNRYEAAGRNGAPVIIWQVEYDAMIGGKAERIAPQYRTKKAAEAAAIKAEAQELDARACLTEQKAARAGEAAQIRAARIAKKIAMGVQVEMFPEQYALI